MKASAQTCLLQSIPRQSCQSESDYQINFISPPGRLIAVNLQMKNIETGISDSESTLGENILVWK